MEPKSTPCFQHSRKFVALLDLVLGSSGIVAVTYILYRNCTRQINLLNGTEKLPFLADEVDDEIHVLQKDFKIFAFLYIFPSVLTFILGILLFLASRKERLIWSTMSLLLNLLIIAGSGGIAFLIFALGTDWRRLVPVVLHTVLQLVLVLIVFDLYRTRRNTNRANISPIKC